MPGSTASIDLLLASHRSCLHNVSNLYGCFPSCWEAKFVCICEHAKFQTYTLTALGYRFTILCRIAPSRRAARRMGSISIFAAGRDAARHDRAMRHNIVSLALLSHFLPPPPPHPSPSPYQDDFVVLHVVNDYDSVMETPLKTEFLTLLAEKFKSLTQGTLQVSFDRR